MKETKNRKHFKNKYISNEKCTHDFFVACLSSSYFFLLLTFFDLLFVGQSVGFLFLIFCSFITNASTNIRVSIGHKSHAKKQPFTNVLMLRTSFSTCSVPAIKQEEGKEKNKWENSRKTRQHLKYFIGRRKPITVLSWYLFAGHLAGQLFVVACCVQKHSTLCVSRNGRIGGSSNSSRSNATHKFTMSTQATLQILPHFLPIRLATLAATVAYQRSDVQYICLDFFSTTFFLNRIVGLAKPNQAGPCFGQSPNKMNKDKPAIQSVVEHATMNVRWHNPKAIIMNVYLVLNRRKKQNRKFTQ